MNSALKPVLAASTGGQTSPAKANVANSNPVTAALAQGAQNSHHNSNNLIVGQNLSQHVNAAPAPPHAQPSMAPVSANMAQMAQNMSHHGNLSHVSQNSATPTIMAASPNKSASTTTPLSLVQDKPTPSQPLALTRTPEKKEPDSSSQANGTLESPKSAASAPSSLKPPNSEVNKEKQDIAKTSPSTPKPPEKPTNTPSTPQKAEPAPASNQVDGAQPSQPKAATASEAPEKSPSKPVDIKPAVAADVAPSQSDSKPTPESANDNQAQDKPSTSPKEEKPVESAKPIVQPEQKDKKEEPKVQVSQPSAAEEKKQEIKEATDSKPVAKIETPKKEAVPVAAEKVVQSSPEKPQPAKLEEPKVEEKKSESKTPAPKAEPKATPKSTLKLATVTPPIRKRRQTSPSKGDGATPAKKLVEAESSTSTPDSRGKRNRTQVQLYQSPTPELAMATKLSASAGRSTPTKPNEDKLIVFYKNEFLAVRNAEGGFYVCQAMQNVYRTTRKIKIRWLSQDKTADASGETYKPDFYDVTDMECVLTTLSLQRASGGTHTLKASEHARANSILERAIKAETSGANTLEVTEEHPDGLDLSLYTDESQLEKKSRKRTNTDSSPRNSKTGTTSDSEKDSPSSPKKLRTTSKRSPKGKTKASPKIQKKPPAGITPKAAPVTKVGIVRRIYRHTATAVTEKAEKTPAKGKSTPVKKTPAKKETPKKESPNSTPTPTRKGRRSAAKETKPSPAPVPSTSTGKTTRTPRKPPSKK